MSRQITQQFSQSLFRIQTRTRTRRHCGGGRPVLVVWQRLFRHHLNVPGELTGLIELQTLFQLQIRCERGRDARQGPDQACFSSLSGSFVLSKQSQKKSSFHSFSESASSPMKFVVPHSATISWAPLCLVSCHARPLHPSPSVPWQSVHDAERALEMGCYTTVVRERICQDQLKFHFCNWCIVILWTGRLRPGDLLPRWRLYGVFLETFFHGTLMARVVRTMDFMAQRHVQPARSVRTSSLLTKSVHMCCSTFSECVCIGSVYQ